MITAPDDVLIADGHHRYGISRTYRDEVRVANGDRPSPADDTLTFVSELVADQLSVEAIHRLYDVDVDELRAADGVFISNSQVGILPAKRCGTSSWQPHPVFRWLARRLRQSGVEEGPA